MTMSVNRALGHFLKIVRGGVAYWYRIVSNQQSYSVTGPVST